MGTSPLKERNWGALTEIRRNVEMKNKAIFNRETEFTRLTTKH